MQPTRISALQGRKVDVKMMKVVNLLNSAAITVTSSYESSIRNATGPDSITQSWFHSGNTTLFFQESSSYITVKWFQGICRDVDRIN